MLQKLEVLFIDQDKQNGEFLSSERHSKVAKSSSFSLTKSFLLQDNNKNVFLVGKDWQVSSSPSHFWDFLNLVFLCYAFSTHLVLLYRHPHETWAQGTLRHKVMLSVMPWELTCYIHLGCFITDCIYGRVANQHGSYKVT